jgi:hypothetical protein
VWVSRAADAPRWLDTWTGVGLITVGDERQGYRMSLSHIAEGEWRATFMAHPMFAPAGLGVADAMAVDAIALGEA